MPGRKPKPIDIKEFQRDQKALKDYLDSLPHGEFKLRKEQFCDQIGITTRTLDSWKWGRSPIRKAYKILINQIVNKKIFTV